MKQRWPEQKCITILSAYNDMEVEHDGSPEFDYFMNFEADHENKLIPYRTEWMVFHEELKLSGSIDMVFQNKKGELEIYDWKRSKAIEYDFDNLRNLLKLFSYKKFLILINLLMRFYLLKVS